MIPDKVTKLRDVDRADKAQRLLSDETLNEAFVNLAAGLHEAWEGCGEAERREKIWLALQALKDVRGYLETAIKQGNISQHDLEILKHGGQS